MKSLLYSQTILQDVMNLWDWVGLMSKFVSGRIELLAHEKHQRNCAKHCLPLSPSGSHSLSHAHLPFCTTYSISMVYAGIVDLRCFSCHFHKVLLWFKFIASNAKLFRLSKRNMHVHFCGCVCVCVRLICRVVTHGLLTTIE